MTTSPEQPPVEKQPPGGALRRLVADPDHGPLPALLLVLTAVTGVVDAVSILRLGRVFVANMTGNVVFVGFAISGAPGFSLAASLSALAGFLIGAGFGGMLVSRVGRDRGRLTACGIAAEAALVVAALALAAAEGATLAAGVRDVIAALLAMAMGLQNALARRLAVPDLTTTVLTLTLTGLAADLRARHRGAAMLRRLLAVSVMFAGALVGAAIVLKLSATAALALAAGLLAVAAIGALFAARRPGRWRAA